jgi:hypothetical protein
MPQMPGGADLHINGPLTNVSVAYYQDHADFISDKVFPTVPVKKRSDMYWKYSKSDFRRTDARLRAPGTESAGTGWKPYTDSYFCDVYAVHDDIDDQTRANADDNFSLDSDSTELCTGQLLLLRDLDWASSYFKSGVWATEFTGVAANPNSGQFVQWNKLGSDPLIDQTDWALNFKLLTGFDLSFMVLGPDVWKALKNHPILLDRIKFTQKGVVTKDLVAGYFDIPVGKLLIAQSSQAIGPRMDDAAAQDASTTYEWVIDPKSVLMGYAPTAPGLRKPSAGYTFTWKGYGAGNREGLTMSNMRMQHLKSDRIEGELTYDHKVVSPDCGIFLNNAVS